MNSHAGSAVQLKNDQFLNSSEYLKRKEIIDLKRKFEFSKISIYSAENSNEKQHETITDKNTFVDQIVFLNQRSPEPNNMNCFLNLLTSPDIFEQTKGVIGLKTIALKEKEFPHNEFSNSNGPQKIVLFAGLDNHPYLQSESLEFILAVFSQGSQKSTHYFLSVHLFEVIKKHLLSQFKHLVLISLKIISTIAADCEKCCKLIYKMSLITFIQSNFQVCENIEVQKEIVKTFSLLTKSFNLNAEKSCEQEIIVLKTIANDLQFWTGSSLGDEIVLGIAKSHAKLIFSETFFVSLKNHLDFHLNSRQLYWILQAESILKIIKIGILDDRGKKHSFLVTFFANSFVKILESGNKRLTEMLISIFLDEIQNSSVFASQFVSNIILFEALFVCANSELQRIEKISVLLICKLICSTDFQEIGLFLRPEVSQIFVRILLKAEMSQELVLEIVKTMSFLINQMERNERTFLINEFIEEFRYLNGPNLLLNVLTRSSIQMSDMIEDVLKRISEK